MTDFDRDSEQPVFYMAHPVASDNSYSIDQNLSHIIEMIYFFYTKCKVRVVAPYHTLCLTLDNKVPENLKVGLEVDCAIVKSLRRLILVGHKLSSGMKDEQLAAMEANSLIWNFVGLTRRGIRESKEIRDHIIAVSNEEHRKEVGRKYSFGKGQWGTKEGSVIIGRGIANDIR